MLSDASNKRRVILYGAFDRYNYGDNLMPILLEKYFLKKFPEKFLDIDFVFSSISDSNLDKFDCKPSIAMTKLLNVAEGSTVIIVGGEVLGADIGTLFLHVQENLFTSKILRMIRRFTPGLLIYFAKKQYQSVWDYPYIPKKESFQHEIKIAYNTVGGEPNKSQLNALKNADFISVRDERTYKGLQAVPKRMLVPDSVLMVSKLVDIDYLASKVRSDIKDVLGNGSFITVQACPYKVRFSARELAQELSGIVKNKNVKVVLLPIGYASGHDDIVFLEKVKSYAKEDLLLLNNLTVWEIMFVIATSSGFYGTSLHGVITAMSYGIPHFCINSDIKKLVSFLETWSVAPFNKPISGTNISATFSTITEDSILKMKNSVEDAQTIIFDSLDDMAKLF
ncbi:polysaccharide pyruvyl transferase family protein [Serratia fonticola]|uniref:polysaccharide pyruvyl transferase family protein n=1 Tax=Serratia fonticola TaxID=47917 RepID=UPI001378EB75|nr:polysaccharide pyruvyl transferase family protein [Serratia fonticola]NCG54139.1 polysaccharide pyruvyl transferase family protein [Serratia fonticola]